MSQVLVKNPAMNECKLLGEEVDVRDGDNVEVRYYFGRPWAKSDYVLLRTVYKPINEHNDEFPPF